MANFLDSLKPPIVVATEAKINAYKNNKDDIKENKSNFFDSFKEHSNEKGIFKFGALSTIFSAAEAFHDNKENFIETGKNYMSDFGESIKDWWSENTIAGNIISRFSGEG